MGVLLRNNILLLYFMTSRLNIWDVKLAQYNDLGTA
jgi:hypothetical protein